ncbi:ISL3 family transposase [Thiohalophilus sp.]|uniref:ISL3 family transposase n=1 Tax=Thiohalophilus sp. TaxID=3028392 RepID=UPI002ACEC5A5|nr:ISL3 family transposase [Thiohalophilus sp.]MDZ7660907.1 ISL3 family transposase [Thiohalophilus sp.]MDZ7804005.1 ISL3 family transposase [Thiohalophilus sp.]
MMDETTLYEKILGIGSPWFVSGIQFIASDKTVEVHVELEDGASLSCPTCGQSAPRYDKRARRWRHLDTCQFKTQVVADVPRIQCPEHGVQTIEVPWAQDNSRYTVLFEAMVIRLLKESTASSVSRMMGLSWNAVDGIMQRAVQRGLSRRGKPALAQLGVDEVAFQKRHEYVTVVHDARGHVLHVAEDRSGASLGGFYEGLTAAQKAQIQSISMDMWPAYIRATCEHIPEAEHKIAFDKFHVNQHLNQAVDMVRKQEHRQLMRQGDETLKGTKYGWLRNYDDLKRNLRREIEQLARAANKTGRAWVIKEHAKGLWCYIKRGWAERAWQQWYQWAIRSRLEPVKKVARMIKQHLWGIINAIVLDVTNARAESINSQIKMLKDKARGFRNRERFKTAILFYCGGLSLMPEKYEMATHYNG